MLDGRGIAIAALKGLCPSCGAPGLFAGPIAFSEKCSVCSVDYTQFNVGDGPAAFLIMIVGAIITVLAIGVELRFSPPFWVHTVLWVPLTAGLVVGLLRIAKALLLILEYQNRAREGQLSE